MNRLEFRTLQGPKTMTTHLVLVAPGLQRSASGWHVLHTSFAKTFNLFGISIAARGFLICGLWVRFPPGSPLISKGLPFLRADQNPSPVARGLHVVVFHQADRLLS